MNSCRRRSLCTYMELAGLTLTSKIRRTQREYGQLIKIGTDICSVTRIAVAYQRFGERFLDRILTADEKRYVLKHPLQTAAGWLPALP